MKNVFSFSRHKKNNIYIMIDSASIMHGFNFEKAQWFTASFQQVLGDYKKLKKLYKQKLYEAKYSSILSYFKPSTSATTYNDLQHHTRQADISYIWKFGNAQIFFLLFHHFRSLLKMTWHKADFQKKPSDTCIQM